MKKLILILSTILLFSCNDKDKLISSYLEGEQKHLNNYNWISRNSKDSNIINSIDSLKIIFKDEALKSKGALESNNTYLIPFDKSIKLINIYIDSCYIN